MLLRLPLSLLVLCMAGCASERLLVPEEDWQTVPTAQRASVDRRHAAELAAANAELTAANAELAAFRRAHPGPVAPAAPARAAAPRPAGDVWDDAVRDHEQARRAAFGRVEADKATWLRTDLAWRELHVETASARLEMVICEREMIRARTIDRSLLGTDSYDSAPVRGQFSRAQQRWYGLSNKANQARGAFERASASLASSKEEYAQLMRNGPAQLRSQPAYADERPARLELTAWAVQRSDIRRRRGLRHFLDDAASAPAGLRKAKIQLAARAVVLPRAPADVAASDPPAAPPGTATPEPAKPSSKPAPTPAAVATRPAPTPAAVATKPASPVPAVATKPAPAPAAVATKPAPAPAAVATKPAPAPAAAATKPAPAPAATAPKTATAAPLPPPASKPVAPRPAPVAPMFPSPSSQSTPSNAAKPTEPSDTASR